MSVTICIAPDAVVKGTKAIKTFMVVCGKCNALFVYNYEKKQRPLNCPRCKMILPERLKYFVGYHTARLKYYVENK